MKVGGTFYSWVSIEYVLDWLEALIISVLGQAILRK